MLGRITYVLIILGVILTGAFILHFLSEDPGTLTLNYDGRVYELTLFEAAIGIVLGITAIVIATKVALFAIALIRFIAGNPDALGDFFSRRRERRGLDALSKSMVALAAGDAKTAAKKAKVAERRLMRPELTRLINAQAAELSGDAARAETYYKALMADPKTALVGTQGLLGRALETGDEDRALTLANHARELAPKDQATLETLYTLQSRKFDWDGARKTLKDQRKAGHIGQLEADKRESGLAFAQAEDALQLGEEEHARALSVQAAKLDPTNVNAVAKAVELLIGSGSKRAASKLVLDSWRVQPHPTLAAAFASIEPDESPAARRRRFETLFSVQPDHAETRYVQAELALVSEDWGSAQKAIQDLRETEPSARSCAILAAVARGQGEPDHIVRAWLARALGAPRNDVTDSALSQAAMLPIILGADDSGASASATSQPEVDLGKSVADAETVEEPKQETAA